MKSITLIEMNDPKLVVRGFDLGHKVASNLVQVFTLTELEYFERHLSKIPEGLTRFANRQPQVSSKLGTVVGHQTSRPRIEVLRETPKPCAKRTVDEQIAGMKMMYSQLGWTFTESGLTVPEHRKGFDRLIVVGDLTLTNNRAYDACEASFWSWRYASDLNTATPSDKDERHPSKNGVYVVWFRDRVEADEELKDFSADMITKKKLKTITLLERELFELVYFMETGGHLDRQNWTLCSGSRYSDGLVPNACWFDDKFGVDYNSSGYRSDGLRSREAVSL